jgi:hypothetical protein
MAECRPAIPGVFAAGDILCRGIKQAVVGAAEGAMAAIAVERYLQGRKKGRLDCKEGGLPAGKPAFPRGSCAETMKIEKRQGGAKNG